MTIEEAREIIKQFRDRQGNSSDDIEAFDLAIEALERKKYKSESRRWKRRYLDLKQRVFKLEEQTRWIPCSERLPKENEYIGNVCKYYLIQDEYGNMHVAHLSNVGWIPMGSLKAIGDEIIGWQELPQPYKAESKIEQTLAYADQDTLMSAT